MSTTEKAEIEIGGGASIKGNVVGNATAATVDDAKNVVVGSDNTQTTAGQDVLQQQYDQRTDSRILDQSRDERRFQQSQDQRSYDQKYDSVAGGSNYVFQNTDSARIWEAIIELTRSVAAVDFKLDNLPTRVGVIEGIVLPVPAPLTAAVPIALVSTVKAATLPPAKPPAWMIITLAVMGGLMFIFLVLGVFFLGRLF